MTELLSLPDLPTDQIGSAQMLAAAAGSGGAVAYKVALSSYLTAAGAAGTYAPLLSPSLRGVPTAPTASAGTNSTQIATTAFVVGAVAGMTAATSTVAPPASLVALTGDDISRALGFTPYSAANPTGYETVSNVATALEPYLTVANAVSTYQSLLGFTPYNATNPSFYQTAAQVAAALSGYATVSFVDARITALLNSAPAAFDTLGEIGAALANDESAAAALTTVVSTKLTSAIAASTYAPIASPTFTGTPVVPGYLTSTIAAATYAPLASPAFTGTPVVPGYLTSTIAASSYAPLASPTFTGTPVVPGYLTTAIAASTYAPLASPTFTGTPVVPGYLTTAIAASTYAPLASPTFTGTPVVPGYLTTAIAASSYALVSSVPVASSVTPSASGTAAVGTSNAYARADHVHPTAAVGSATVTAGATYPMVATDRRVYVRKTTGSATAITLPASPILHEFYVIKDSKGDAATNPITISGGTMDGVTSWVLNNNYESVTFVNNGVDWSIVA